MSGGSKQAYKQFTINSCEDALSVLGVLIGKTIVDLEKFKEYAAELDLLIQKYTVCVAKEKIPEILIPAREYDDVNDKLLYRQRELLKVLADHQSSSFSYFAFRNLLQKMGFLSSDLSDDVTDILKEFLDLRNWSFHFPQSMLVASREVALKNIPDELKAYVEVKPQLNPVIVPHTKDYDLPMLISLGFHAEKRIEQFELVLSAMKEDYSEIYRATSQPKKIMLDGKIYNDIVYVSQAHTARLKDPSGDTVQISMAIQKSKYDGSDEKYNEWTIKRK